MLLSSLARANEMNQHGLKAEAQSTHHTHLSCQVTSNGSSVGYQWKSRWYSSQVEIVRCR